MDRLSPTVAAPDHLRSPDQNEIARRARDLADRLVLLKQQGLCGEGLDVKVTDDETGLEFFRNDNGTVQDSALSIQDKGVTFIEKVNYTTIEGQEPEKTIVISAPYDGPATGSIEKLFDDESILGSQRAEELLVKFFNQVNKEIEQRTSLGQRPNA